MKAKGRLHIFAEELSINDLVLICIFKNSAVFILENTLRNRRSGKEPLQQIFFVDHEIVHLKHCYLRIFTLTVARPTHNYVFQSTHNQIKLVVLFIVASDAVRSEKVHSCSMAERLT